ncbi:MAG: hypothetical protein U0Q22_11965 [Acidimicrobiales bacterium]
MMVAFGVAAMGLGVVAGSAGASGTGSVTPNPVPIPAIGAAGFTWKTNAATVDWSAMQTGKPVYISICRRPQSDPQFVSFGDSCSAISEVIVSAAFQTNGAGSKAVKLFRGENPDGDSGWGCYAPGDTAPQGVEKLTTCYIRVASDSESDTTYAHTIPFTISDDTSTTTTTTVPGNPDPVVPESSSVIFLPIVAGGVALLAVGVQRRRRSLNV